MTWQLTVIGSPAPQGSKRFLGMGPKSGKARFEEASKGVGPWREAVKTVAYERRPHEPLDGPLFVRMVFTLRRPPSIPKRRRFPSTIPDLSKLARCTEDALTEAGVWRDDARVVEYLRLAKCYVGSLDPRVLDVPGVWIEILTEEEWREMLVAQP